MDQGKEIAARNGERLNQMVQPAIFRQQVAEIRPDLGAAGRAIQRQRGRERESARLPRRCIAELKRILAGVILEMADQLVEYQAVTEMASEQAQESDKDLGTVIVDGVKGFFSDQILAPIVQMRIRMQTSLQLLATQIIELVAIWILRVCVYIIFMLQIIYSTVLVILGPFSVVVSILPAFRDAFTTWIARFVSVNLYVGVAYLILYITGRLQQYALEVEIDKYEYLLSTGGGADRLEKMAWLASNGFLSFGLVIVAFFVSAIAITTVPSISTWIISTSGISSAATTAGRMGSSASKSISRAKLI